MPAKLSQGGTPHKEWGGVWGETFTPTEKKKKPGGFTVTRDKGGVR